MAASEFIKKNFVLIAGLSLPVLLMAFFFIAGSLPNVVSDPPRYDLVFSSYDYGGGSSVPIALNLVVKDGELIAQYARREPPNSYQQWKKLYLYEAKTQRVRELPFGFPADMDKITGTKEEPVAATRNRVLDTTLKSPDGYELSFDGYSRSGLVGDLFFNHSYRSEVRLRKGNNSIKLLGDRGQYFYYGNVQFVGWVTGTRQP